MIEWELSLASNEPCKLQWVGAIESVKSSWQQRIDGRITFG